MEPVSLMIAVISALAAASAKPLVGRFFQRFHRPSPILEVVTSTGKRFRIAASELTRDKVAEITNTGSAAGAH
jgi:hypothetical protein